LQGEARKEWKRVVPELDAAGLLVRVDRAALASYCQAWGRWVDAEEKLAVSGPVLKGDHGLYQNPYLHVANKAMEQLYKFLIEFGLSPAARSRVQAPREARAAGVASRKREAT
ncbi:phage terminase small subunit P27 family, partial [Pseudomonas aeruginosa]|uniref:phage terminase small subunit P27 family n=1 Tax=Pseudomonas aeruginosa TaxID=287 RepID=UPI001AD76A7D